MNEMFGDWLRARASPQALMAVDGFACVLYIPINR
jgi:hypothetical protein